MTADLLQFLHGRLDDDTRAATAAKPGTWHTDGNSVYATHPTDEVVDYTESAEHIARWNPARVLVEVDVKRRLLAIHRRYIDEPGQACLGCAGGIEWEACPVVPLIALPYADHPDYLEEWRV